MKRMLPIVLLAAACAEDPPLRVVPDAGSQAGGETLRIEGSGLDSHGAVSVYVGQRSAKGVVVHSPWLIQIVTPQSEVVGTMDVLLRFADGEERRIEQAFTYEEQPGIVIRPRIGG